MKRVGFFAVLVLALVAALEVGPGYAAGEVTTVTPATDAAEGLDLNAVSELFKDSKDLEQFERALNDPNTGVNNLDLDGDGNVDFIRVVEESEGDTRVVVLQAVLGENEFQDVATIEVEREAEDHYNMQVRGVAVIYGPDFYIVPVVRVYTWPCVIWMYGPRHHHYRPGWHWGHYPKWWKRHRTVTVNVYRTRTVKYKKAGTFDVAHTTRVKSVTRVKYERRTSTRVKASRVKIKTGSKGTKAETKTKAKKKTKARTKTKTKKETKTKTKGRKTVRKKKG